MIGGTLPPVIALLLADTKDFTAKMGEAGAEMEALTKKGGGAFQQLATVGKAALLTLGAAAIGVGVASVDMAAKFQTQMERLHTQAGVPQAAIAGLSNSVLNLAGQVATNPTSLAEALFHVMSAFQSTGITGAKAMDILKVAAEGAKIGGANLVDTTNALDAAIVSGIRGAGDYQQAMGALNATVGAGDMTMQNLAEALSNGVMPVVKNYGLSLLDVGSALATFGDNNIRGAQAGTALRMAVQAMAVPMKAGAGVLAGMGMSSKTMAEDMQNGGGLIPALQDLKTHMEAAGITGDRVGQVLTQIFGKRAGTGVAVLYDQLDRLKSKYGDISGAANTFGDAWAQTQKTFSVEWGKVVATVEALGIRLGLWLIPIVEQVAIAVSHAVEWLSKHTDIALMLAAAIAGPLLLAMGAFIVSLFAADGALAILVSPIGLIVLAIGALSAAVVWLWIHWDEVWKWISENKAYAVLIMAFAPITAALVALVGTAKWVQQNWDDIFSSLTHPVQALGDLWHSVFGGGGNGGPRLPADILTTAQAAGKRLASGLPYDVSQTAQQAGQRLASGLPPATFDTAQQAGQRLANNPSSLPPDVLATTQAAGKRLTPPVPDTGVVATAWAWIQGATADAVAFMQRTIDSFVKWATPIWHTVSTAVASAWHEVATSATSAWNAVYAAVSSALGSVVAFVKENVGVITTWVHSHWDEIKTATDVAWHWISAIVSITWDGIVAAVKVAAAIIVPTVTVIWEEIKGYAIISWDMIKGIVSVAWDAIVGVIRIARDIILGVVGVFLDLLSGHWSKAWHDLVQMTSNLGHDLFTMIGSLFHDILSLFGGLANDFWNAGANIVRALADGITAMIPSVLGTISNLASQVASHIPLIGKSISNFLSTTGSSTPGPAINAQGGVGSNYGPAFPGHAAGGTAQGWSWVGEKGPELAYFNQPTPILPNGVNPGGGGPTGDIVIQLDGATFMRVAGPKVQSYMLQYQRSNPGTGIRAR